MSEKRYNIKGMHGFTAAPTRQSRFHARTRSGVGRITESMPGKLTPRSRNGITAVARSKPQQDARLVMEAKAKVLLETV